MELQMEIGFKQRYLFHFINKSNMQLKLCLWKKDIAIVCMKIKTDLYQR